MEQRIENWKDLRFGMFIHWGLYAIMGRGEWAMWTEAIDVDEYRKLADEFTAEKFDARAWAKTAKAAGMKYMVLPPAITMASPCGTVLPAGNSLMPCTALHARTSFANMWRLAAPKDLR